MDSDRKIKSISLLKYAGFNVNAIDNVLAQRNVIASDIFAIAEDIHSELTFSNIPTDSDHTPTFHKIRNCENYDVL